MNAILKEDPPDLASFNPPIPSDLQRILRHCLEKSPQQRYQSASDIAFNLSDLGSNSLAPQAAGLKIRERFAWIAAAVMFLIGLVLAVAYVRRAPGDRQPLFLSVSPPEKTIFTGGTAPAISPNGRYVAFVASDSSGESRLYFRAFDMPNAAALEGTEGAWQPFWSPDSRFLAYFAQGKLKKIPLAGGPPQELCNVVGSGIGGTWGPEGVILFSQLYGLYRVSQEGAVPTIVETTVEGTTQESQIESGRLSPYFLPDGHHFLFTVPSHRPEIRGVYLGSLDSKETRRLLSVESHVSYAAPGYLLFIQDWTLMAQRFDARRFQLKGEAVPVADQLTNTVHGMRGSFSVSGSGALAYFRGGDARQLTWLNRRGEELGAVGVPDAYSLPSLSPDEKTIAVTKKSQSGSDIWLIDLARGHPTRFTFDSGPDILPIWSPDGSRIVFTSSRNGSWDLYQKATTGAAQEEVLLKSKEGKFPTAWSSDGRFIAYNRISPEGRPDLWVLPLLGDRKPIPFVQSEFGEMFGYFSPNGRWLAYTSLESGRQEVYIRPFSPPSAGIWPVSTGGGSHPRWQRDGKQLFYLSPQRKLMAVEVIEGPRFRVGVPRPLFQMRLSMDFDWSLGNYAVAADGQRFLFVAPPADATSPTITVVLNWPAALKKVPLQ
jgi:Tol biopolymer transport system component